MAERIREVAGPSSSSSFVHDHVSKTLFGLTTSDVIRVTAYQTSGSQQDISAGEQHTYVTITKVG